MPSDAASFTIQTLTEELLELTFTLPYSRKLETEADEFGIMIAARVN